MNEKILKTVDFFKILQKLSSHGSTSLGKERAEQLRPCISLVEVKNRLQATDEACLVERLKGSAPFGGIRDIKGAVHRARIGGILNAAELLDIANTLNGSRRLKKFLFGIAESHSIKLLKELCLNLTEHKALEDDILSCIDDQAEIMDSASVDLSRIRRELKTGESKVRERLDQMIRTPSIQKMLQDNLITIRNDRYVIPVKQEYRASFGGIIHDQSASGATVFIEPEAIVTLNNKLRELKLNEAKEMDKILQILSSKVAEAADLLVLNVEILAELDFIFAKAGLAQEMKATLPIMNDRGFIKLKKGRHPLISGEPVPLDTELGNNYSTIIITGPNTGGKTVSLKTIGLLNLMAMSGLFIPAEDGSQMCVFDAVYADIGDEQSIEQNLSTFSSHMTNIIGILRDMTPKSLVLLDELGAGTDPAEGSALAIAILEYIHRMGCRIVATTHYSELKAYAYDRRGTINASMEFDITTLSPTYRLLVGVAGRSNAFAIAERLGLPRPIIDIARGQVNEEDQRVENMIASLEHNRLMSENQRKSAEQLHREAEQLRKELEEEKLRFELQRDKLMEKAQLEAREAVVKARKEAEEIIADLRRMALEESVSVKEHKLIEVRRRLEDAVPKLAKSNDQRSKKRAEPIQAGDEVKVISLGQKGYVVEETNSNEVVVQMGIIKMKIKKSDLEVLQPVPTKKSPVNIVNVQRSRDEHVRTELDLRGSNLEESLLDVDRFLDEAFLSNLGQVHIIHGKGTGVLRSGIQQFLQKHRNVKNYRLGNFGEGGTGVTVVEFK